jgi:serine protease AprX
MFKLKAYLLVCLTLLTTSRLFGQNESDKKLILRETNIDSLSSFIEKSKSQYTRNQAIGREKSPDSTITNRHNRTGYLSGFNKNGLPVYDFDDNIDVARTIRVKNLWPGSYYGYDLDGSGVLIGHWEAGGLALTSHQELRNRISKGESATVTSHATHTAGTMIGSGVINAAKGMAPGAKIVSRKSDNDEIELAEFAISGGILSNHSYSSGDPDGDTPVYGQYTDHSREWDEISYNAPYLMMCKSAGNNRNDGVNTSDDGYDLVYTISTAKNILTVGAVEDIIFYDGPGSVVQTAFSNWGPTDDWRIKPDLVTSGASVRSADNDNNTSYTIKSGTSMAVAAATGAIALLQQHYHNLNEQYMKSATVKALLVCTTEEAGIHPGPDFQNGWGLLNAERAAEVISQNEASALIEELELANGVNYSKEIYIDGTSQVALTIAWTDPPGTPQASHDNQNPILVNDLDLRLSKSTTTYKPWVMTPNSSSNNFDDKATKADNIRDNVERIDIPSLSEGMYTITVSHKGSLRNGQQAFSLVARNLTKKVVGLANELPNSALTIFPVPSKDGLFNMLLPHEFAKRGIIHVFDVNGRLKKSIEFYERPGTLDLSFLESGLYYVKVKGSNTIISQAVIIQK